MRLAFWQRIKWRVRGWLLLALKIKTFLADEETIGLLIVIGPL
jgi:hypothetical protein